MASAQVDHTALKKPTSAYWLWLNDNRAKISSLVGGKITEVAKKGGEMWKALPDSAKLPYEKTAKEQKDAYEKFVATDEGKKALTEKKAASAEIKNDKAQKAEAKEEKFRIKEEKQNDRACKAAVKAVGKDDALKKPMTSYWMWLGDNRAKITSLVGGKGSDVAKKGGEMWKAVSNADKAPYEKKAKEQKEAYDKYIASPEGTAALKAFKDATSAAKDSFKPKEDPAETVEEDAKEVKEAGTKRKASPQTESVAEKGAPVAKKGRGRPPATPKAPTAAA